MSVNFEFHHVNDLDLGFRGSVFDLLNFLGDDRSERVELGGGLVVVVVVVFAAA